MSEIRQDPTTKEWVIIATERRKRPDEFVHHSTQPNAAAYLSSCPFCPGNEAMTAQAVLTFKSETDKTWRLRAFPNKFPAVTPSMEPVRKVEQNMFLSVEGWGFHEVLVETPVHNRVPAFMTREEIAGILTAYRERYAAMSQTPRVKNIVIFKNHGAAAGTSIEHPHSQIVATAIMPTNVRNKFDLACNYYNETGRSLYADLRKNEVEAGTRIIMSTNDFVVFHPFASHRPFETWIMPLVGQSTFEQITDGQIDDLAEIVRTIFLKMYRGLENPDFNLVIDSAPVGEQCSDFYVWHMKVIPRITEMAGFEIGSGIFINTALPEETAKFMREVNIGK